MSLPPLTLFAQGSGQALLACETQRLAAVLGRQRHDRALFIGVASTDWAGSVDVACPVRLCLREGGFEGDLRARADEPLPFLDQSFSLVVLSHVLEWIPYADALLQEAIRVLAPQGTVVVTGFHPFSAWLPWLLCRRESRPLLTAPGWLRQRLALRGVETTQVLRCGSVVPHGRGGRGWQGLGGGFVLIGQHHRAAVMPLRLRQARPAPAAHGWIASPRRECA